MMSGGYLLLLLVLLSNVALVSSNLVLPGVTPSAWDNGEQIVLKANKITSTDDPVVYDYYDLPFCKRRKKTKARAGNLGESLSGDATTASPYEVCCFLAIWTMPSGRLMSTIFLICVDKYTDSF